MPNTHTSPLQPELHSSVPTNGVVEFLGLDFDPWPLGDVLRWLEQRGVDSDYGYVVTPNVDHMIRLADASAEVRRAYDEADLRLCDSRIMARLGAWAGAELVVVPGSDLTAALFAQVLAPGDRVCLVGGGEGDGTRLEALHAGVAVIQHRPPMGLRDDVAARACAVEAVVAVGARIVLFAVGSPQQELLAHEMASRADARGTGLCIGASIDFLLGNQRRAPRLIQQMSLEWAWRLLGNPRRLARRYLVDGPAILPMVWRWRYDRASRLP